VEKPATTAAEISQGIAIAKEPDSKKDRQIVPIEVNMPEESPEPAPGIRDLFCHLSAWGLFAAVQVGMATARERALDKTESRAFFRR
jgi:hypothetical protein